MTGWFQIAYQRGNVMNWYKEAKTSANRDGMCKHAVIGPLPHSLGQIPNAKKRRWSPFENFSLKDNKGKEPWRNESERMFRNAPSTQDINDIDSLESKQNKDIRKRLEDEENEEEIQRIMSESDLSEREKDVVLTWLKGSKMDFIARRLGVTRERIRQILEFSLSKMRSKILGRENVDTDDKYRINIVESGNLVMEILRDLGGNASEEEIVEGLKNYNAEIVEKNIMKRFRIRARDWVLSDRKNEGESFSDMTYEGGSSRSNLSKVLKHLEREGSVIQRGADKSWRLMRKDVP